MLQEILKRAAFHTFFVLVLVLVSRIDTNTRSASHVPCISAVLVQEILKRAAFHTMLVLVLVQEMLKCAAFHTFLVLVQC